MRAPEQSCNGYRWSQTFVPASVGRTIWQRGEQCDAPGQKVGAATNPHVAGGMLLVDTNTGSTAFQFE
jgi:hypothetical protein